MAQHEVGRIIINDGTNFPSYSTGDEIIAYWNDVTEAVDHERNTVAMTTGDVIQDEQIINNEVSTTVTGYQICQNVDLVGFHRTKVHQASGTPIHIYNAYPYFRPIIKEYNSPSCQLIVCDLISSGTPIIVDATSTITLGTIKVSAYSTQVVKFKSTSDPAEPFFDFTTAGRDADSVSGNVYTVTFFEYPGVYYIQAVDANGCGIRWNNITIGVDITNSYGEKYYYDYVQREGGNTRRVRLKKKGFFSGTTEIVNTGEDPLMVDWARKGGDKFAYMVGSSLKLSIISETDFQWTSEFVNTSEREWLIELYDDPAGTNTLIHRGYYNPLSYFEPYAHVPYGVELIATDGLADLKEKDYLTDKIIIQGAANPFSQLGGLSLHGDASIIEILTFCLQKTGLEMSLRTAMNVYEDSHDSPAGANGGNGTGTAADDPLAQTYLNNASFYENSKPLNCFDVLHGILRALPDPCRLFQSEGYWWVVPINNSTSPFAYREWDASGTYVTNSTQSTIIDFKASDQSTRAVYLPGATMSFTEIYDKVRTIVNRKIVDNLVNNFDASTLKPDGTGYEGWTNVNNGDNGSFKAYKPISDELVKITGTPRLNAVINDEVKRTTISSEGYRLEFNFNDDQGTDAYTIASGAITYKNLDSFEVSISYFFKPLTNTTRILKPLYVPLKWSLKVGSKYYQLDDSWTATETVNQYFVENFEEEQKFTISGTFDETVTTDTTTTFELRVYDMDTFYVDVDSAASTVADFQDDIEAYDATGFGLGNRIIARYTGGGKTNYYYELASSNAAEDDVLVVNSSLGGSKKWHLKATLEQTALTSLQSKFYLYGVRFMTFPNGNELQDTFYKDYVVSNENAKTFEVDLFHFDLSENLNNSENLILNYWKKSDGTPTAAWGTNSLTSQRLVGDAITTQIKLPNRVISYDSISDVNHYLYNTIRTPGDDNRIYMINKLTVNDQKRRYTAEIQEISSDTGVTIGEFKSDEFASAEFLI